MKYLLSTLLLLGAASSAIAGPHGHKGKVQHEHKDNKIHKHHSVVRPVKSDGVEEAVGLYSKRTIVATKTTPTTAATPSATSSVPTGKRGLAYNNATLTKYFTQSKEISWAYNWGSWTDAISSSLNYVPLLWGTSPDFTNYWTGAAQHWITTGAATHLMSFNEPDYEYQANLTPSAAAAGYKTYMQPFAGKAKLGSPAVTNGGAPMGLTWLGQFFKACTNCTIDFVPIHWYSLSSEIATLKSQVLAAHQLSGGKPVWITEFGVTDGGDQAFLQQIMPWLDAQPYVERYAYFMVSDGLLVNANGTGVSSYGRTFKWYGSGINHRAV